MESLGLEKSAELLHLAIKRGGSRSFFFVDP